MRLQARLQPVQHNNVWVLLRQKNKPRWKNPSASKPRLMPRLPESKRLRRRFWPSVGLLSGLSLILVRWKRLLRAPAVRLSWAARLKNCKGSRLVLMVSRSTRRKKRKLRPQRLFPNASRVSSAYLTSVGNRSVPPTTTTSSSGLPVRWPVTTLTKMRTTFCAAQKKSCRSTTRRLRPPVKRTPRLVLLVKPVLPRHTAKM